jgi:hypothetical protein
MNWIWIIALVIIVIIIVEIFKHKFRHNLLKYFILVVIVVLILMLVSTFTDLSTFFEPDGFFVKTGNTIKDTVTDQASNLNENNTVIDKISDSTKEVFNSE